MVLVNLSQPQAPPSQVPVDPATAPTVVVPVYSSWFTLDSVHENERRGLPEFFPGQEALYREWRDWMVQAYRQRPREYLSLTSCRRHLVGDVGALLRVHAFLEQWGLINHQAELSSTTSQVPLATTPSGATAAVPPALQQMAADAATIASLPAPTLPGSLFRCSLCGTECPSHYYTASSGNKLIVCTGCFAEGRHPPGLTSDDLQPVNVLAQRLSEPDWREEETLRLLELVEKGGESPDWEVIAAELGTGKSREQCLLRFLQLPLLEQVDSAATWQAARELAGEDQLSLFPALGDNPLMATLLLLAQLVHPRVASAAAQAAIAAISAEPDQASAIDEQKIAATTMGIAAAKAQTVADEEAKRTSRLRDMLIEAQLAKLKIKVNLLEALDRSLVTERVNLEKERLVIFHDRVKLRKWQLEQTNGGTSGAGVESKMDIDADSVITELK